MKRIVIAEPERYAPEALALYREVGEVVEGPFTADALSAAVMEATVLVVRLGHTVNASLLNTASNLRAVVSPTTGLDHIDLDAARARGVEILSLRGETAFLDGISATAELTWGLILAVTRSIPAAHGHVLDGGWDRDSFIGRDLKDRRLGVVGLGRLGRQVAHIGMAFGMRVAAFDTNPLRVVDGVAMCGSLVELCSLSDIVSIHVPLAEDTIGLIGRDAVAALPQGAVLVNTSRGAVIDESALIAGLESGKLGGVGLDVLAGERDIAQGVEPPIIAFARSRSNVVLTPHIGGATSDSMARTEVFMARKCVDFLNASR